MWAGLFSSETAPRLWLAEVSSLWCSGVAASAVMRMSVVLEEVTLVITF